MQTLPLWPYPRLIAHRGGGTLAPENTLAAMRVGHQFGYRMVEFDAKLTQDQLAVLLHDSTLERTTTGSGAATDYTYSSLAQLDAGSWFDAAFAGEPVPCLSAVARYTLAQNIASNIEIKPSPGLEQRTGSLIAQQVRLDWAASPLPPLLSSFSIECLQAARVAAPELPRGWITAELLPEWRDVLAQLGCVSLHLKHTLVTQALVGEVHQAGFRLATWTVNEPARAAQLLEWGVDAVITDALNLIQPD